MYNNVLLVYFSGTGGTRRAADTFEKQLIERSCEVSKYDLDISTCNKNKENISEALLKSQLVILLFAVHAVDAPEPVFRWIEQIEGVGKKAA
ncbi:MAG: hypothetical protein Q8920_10125, partial [Bacillota bacterium]|nr:hypothetical protein [Bacillota bacterium]